MAGAQPLAATMNGAVFLGVDVDPARIERRLQTGYLDRMSRDLDEALELVLRAKEKREALSVGLVGNAAEIMPALVERGVVPDVLTDQTSAHDTLNGYVPIKRSPDEDLAALRRDAPKEYVRRALESIAEHVRALLEMQARGAITFEYGNNLRAQAVDAGVKAGADAMADWRILNALINTAGGASWVSVHHGGGVGIGYSLHAGMVVVCDGTPEADARLGRVLTSDPGMGVIRHVDAGYEAAIRCAEERGVEVPGLNY